MLNTTRIMRTASILFVLGLAAINIACLTYNTGFKSLDEVQEEDSIVFGEIILLRINENGTFEDVHVRDNKIKFTVISRETSEFYNYEVNAKEDLYHLNLPAGRYTLAQVFAWGTCRIYGEFEVSPDRPLSYIGSIKLVFSGYRNSRYRIFIEDDSESVFSKLKKKFPELEGEPSTDLIVLGEGL